MHSDLYRKPAHTNEITPFISGLQATHAVHRLTAFLVFATCLLIHIISDSNPTLRVIVKSTFANY